MSRNDTISLRIATIEDADLLLKWRNDISTRMASHSVNKILRKDHIAWLQESFNDPNRQLFITEENGQPVGTVRTDFRDGIYELSWTVASDARGHGIAKQMVALAAHQISGPICAEIKVGNTISASIAEYAGMQLARIIDGIQHYSRDSL